MKDSKCIEICGNCEEPFCTNCSNYPDFCSDKCAFNMPDGETE